jgi:glutaredoxin
MNHRTVWTSACSAALIGIATFAHFANVAQAQTIYRIVGPDGKVVFSDKPPVTADQGKVTGTGAGARGAAENSSLPTELRKVVAQYPVTLYAASKCAPCDAGRSLLVGRGVPFTERTVNTSEDSEALQRLNGENSLPVLSIGGKRMKGYADSEWNQYLDAAGYPTTSALPKGFKNAPPSPLAVVQKPAPAQAIAKPDAVFDAPPAPVANPSNPAGIQF